jgi:GT2 family glycosyltransferase
MAGCIWMVRRTVFAKIGEYDTDLFIPYEDTDFCLRAARAGFEIFLAPQAIAYHPLTKKTNLPKQILYLGITTPERAYRVMRNKIIFMRKHATRRQLLKFYFFLFPLYLFIHTFFILRAFRFDILKLYYHGTVDGLLYKKNYAK